MSNAASGACIRSVFKLYYDVYCFYVVKTYALFPEEQRIPCENGVVANNENNLSIVTLTPWASSPPVPPAPVRLPEQKFSRKFRVAPKKLKKKKKKPQGKSCLGY